MSSNPGPRSTCTSPPSWSVATQSRMPPVAPLPTSPVNWSTTAATAAVPLWVRPCRKMLPACRSVIAASVAGVAADTSVPTMNSCPTRSSRLSPASGSAVGVGVGVEVGVGAAVVVVGAGADAGAHPASTSIPASTSAPAARSAFVVRRGSDAVRGMRPSSRLRRQRDRGNPGPRRPASASRTQEKSPRQDVVTITRPVSAISPVSVTRQRKWPPDGKPGRVTPARGRAAARGSAPRCAGRRGGRSATPPPSPPSRAGWSRPRAVPGTAPPPPRPRRRRR